MGLTELARLHRLGLQLRQRRALLRAAGPGARHASSPRARCASAWAASAPSRRSTGDRRRDAARCGGCGRRPVNATAPARSAGAAGAAAVRALATPGSCRRARPARARACGGEAGRERAGTWVRFALQLAGRPGAAGALSGLWLPAYAGSLRVAGAAAARAAGARLHPGAPAEWAQALGFPVEKLGRLLVVEDALQCLP